jgi:single-strand selective monofunctional uracil DNA glycosylase
MTLSSIFNRLNREIRSMTFSLPVAYVYNPLEYAKKPHDTYLKLYGTSPREVLLLGMNPGPFGMAQTGVPFGEITATREWLKIEEAVKQPPRIHPKRPVEGFDCKKSEVSGRRLWGWAKNRFINPETFFDRYFVANYCPLIFIEEGGRNRTPDKLPKAEREPLFEACDRALIALVDYFSPSYLVGVGAFAEKRAQVCLKENDDLTIGKITHPSPANPRANRGWEAFIEKELTALGIEDFSPC